MSGAAYAADAAASGGTGAQSATVGEVIVTAQRRSEKLKDVPLTVVAVSGSQLAAAGVTTVRDLGNVVSGYTVGGSGFFLVPAIRGVSTFVVDGEAQSPNALYIDGVYQPLGIPLAMELPDINNVEVLKGPQGTLFGRNATGGAIQLFTKPVSFTPRVDLSAAVGEFTGNGGSRSSSNVDLTGFATGPIIPGLLAGSISGGFRNTPGYLTNDRTGQRDGKIEKESVRGKLLFTPTSNTSFVLDAHYLTMEDNGEGVNFPYSGTTSLASGYPGAITPSIPWHDAYDQPGSVSYTGYGFSLTSKFNYDFGRFTSITAYEYGHPHTVTSFNGSSCTYAGIASGAPCADYDFDLVSKTFTQEVDFASRDFGPFSFTAGVFYLNMDAPSFSTIDPVEFPPGGIPGGINYTLHQQSVAVYGEARYKVTDRLNLIAGVRYNVDIDDDSPLPTLPNIKLTATAVTPRASIRYDLTDQLNVYFTFSEGYKAPMSGATNLDSLPTPFLPVAAERILSYEGGFKFANRIASLDVSGFYYDYTNKQEQTFNGFGPYDINTGPVRIDGVDVDATLRVNSDFSVRTGLEWLAEAKYLDFPSVTETGITFFNATGYRLVRAPDVSGSTTIQYLHRFSRGAVDGNITASYASLIYESVDHSETQPASVLLSAQLGYKFGDSGVHISIYGHNLTNTVQQTGGIVSFFGSTRTLGAPREVGLKADYSF
jgi:iron complex outermembrane receptor protein